jgi:hypothetical protein
MKGLISFKKRLKKHLKDPEFRKAFDKEEAACSSAILKVRGRAKKR